MEAYITRRGDGYNEVRFPFDAGVVASLKASIPPKRRSWSPSEKCWLVHQDYLSMAYEVLRRRFGDVVVTDAAAPPPRPKPIRATDTAYRELHLQPSAPESLVQVAYKHLSKQAHPDAGGSHDAMLRLNDAYDVLRKRRAAS